MTTAFDPSVEPNPKTGAEGTRPAHLTAEEALRARERELSLLVDLVPSHVWRLLADGEPTFFNKRMVDFVGMDVADIHKPGMSPLSAMIAGVVHPKDAPRFEDTLRRCLASGDAFAMRYRLRRADGVYRWMSSRAEPMRDQGGKIVHWYGICHDIDDQVHAEQALRRSEQDLQKLVAALGKSERLFRQLVESLPAMIDCAAPNGEPIYRSRRLSEFLGYKLEELDGTGKSRLAGTLDAGVHPEDVAGVKAQYAHSLATGEPYLRKHRLRRFDGEYRWVETRAAALRNAEGAIVQWSVICLDIDDEVRAQQALREQEREFSQLVNMVPSLLWRLTPEGEPTFFNKRMIDFIGLDVGQYDEPGMSGLSAAIATLTHPDDRATLASVLHHSLVTGQTFSMKYRLRRADGVYRWVEGRGEPLRDESGGILQWYGLVHDIDDQVHAERALRESAQRLRDLVDALPTHIWATSPEGEPSYLNRRLAEYVGLSLGDLDTLDASRLQMAIQSSVQPDDAPAVGRALAHSFSTGETFAMKYRTRRADGAYRWVNTRAEPLRDASGRIVQWYGVMFDIDDEVRAQDELRRTQDRLAVASRAASLAELSASIAHEVNQPLAAVVANSHACQRWLAAEPPNLERAKATTERIVRDANSAADVVSRIRALFRQTTQARTISSLGALIAEVGALLTDELRKGRVVLDVMIAPNLPPIAFDRVQIQQVLVNLMRNAVEAMDAVAGARVLTVRARRGRGALTVEVSDSGVGLAVADRIFEPFFSTKGNGMGMGLAICRSIVELHGGRLWAANNEPRGATFVFTLPVGPSSPET